MKILFTFLTTLFVSTAMCQEWKLIHSENGVNIYQKEADCEIRNVPDEKRYLIKIENTNASAVDVEWDTKIWYNDNCINCNSNSAENHHSFRVEANSNLAGNCESTESALYVFRSFIDLKSPTKLTKYELQNVTVAIINK